MSVKALNKLLAIVRNSPMADTLSVGFAIRSTLKRPCDRLTGAEQITDGACRDRIRRFSVITSYAKILSNEATE